jgi:integrase
VPAKQRGHVRKRGRWWHARYYDEHGARRERGGFRTKTEANDWLEWKVQEVEDVRDGKPVALRRRQIPTFAELCDEYLAQHAAESNTIRTLTARLKPARKAFGTTRVDRIAVQELARWRTTLPERSAWHITKAARQVLSYAVAVKLLDENPAKLIANPPPKRREVPTFASWAEVELVSEELGDYRLIPLFAAGTGLRPEEWIGLERRDVDRKTGVVHVRRVFTDGQVKLYGKQDGSLRTVPLPTRVLAALDEMPARIDTRLMFPGPDGVHLGLHNWRAREWTPAVRAAGLEHRPPYALRHTFASFAIQAGVPLFHLARFMGTSVEQIDRTYGHLLPDSLELARERLDAFLEGEAASEEDATARA